nr:7474_t:CDS:2 [Entrophospora candida]
MNPNVPPTSSIILPPPPTSLTLNNKDVKFLNHETTTLIVKSLPNFPEPDLINFLNHFGPKEIRLGKSRHMKNSAFLDFWDRNSASLAFNKIQDLGDINGKRIRVEYASPTEPIAPSLGINYPPLPNLHYRYPPPTIESLQNIMNAITTVPK